MGATPVVLANPVTLAPLAVAPTGASTAPSSATSHGPRMREKPEVVWQRWQTPRSKNHTCALPVCRFHEPEAALLYVNEHTDGAGHRLKNMLEGIAIARALGFNFGGALAVGSVETEHGVNFRELLGD